MRVLQIAVGINGGGVGAEIGRASVGKECLE